MLEIPDWITEGFSPPGYQLYHSPLREPDCTLTLHHRESSSVRHFGSRMEATEVEGGSLFERWKVAWT